MLLRNFKQFGIASAVFMLTMSTVSLMRAAQVASMDGVSLNERKQGPEITVVNPAGRRALAALTTGRGAAMGHTQCGFDRTR